MKVISIDVMQFLVSSTHAHCARATVPSQSHMGRRLSRQHFRGFTGPYYLTKIQSFAKILAATEYQYINISGALWVIK